MDAPWTKLYQASGYRVPSPKAALNRAVFLLLFGPCPGCADRRVHGKNDVLGMTMAIVQAPRIPRSAGYGRASLPRVPRLLAQSYGRPG
ncbi:MAG: hypothetical protein Q8M19_22060 [Reyranella sp.]|nr:hypothetical protein [Reyranella sp.]